MKHQKSQLEDYVKAHGFLGKLPEARYAALDAQYAKEQGASAEEISGIETALANHEKGKNQPRSLSPLSINMRTSTRSQRSC